MLYPAIWERVDGTRTEYEPVLEFLITLIEADIRQI